MKIIMVIFGLLTLSSSIFAAEPNTYSCEGYTLTILDEAGRANLKNDSANSSSNLSIAGPNSGFSQTVLLSGTLVPVGRDVLARVLVTVDDTLLEGANAGKISVSEAIDGSQGTDYNCMKQ
jgi:hypothetical protein